MPHCYYCPRAAYNYRWRRVSHNCCHYYNNLRHNRHRHHDWHWHCKCGCNCGTDYNFNCANYCWRGCR